MIRVAKIPAALCRIVIILLTSTACAQEKGTIKIAVYNPDLDGGISLGEKGVLECLKSQDNLKPGFVTDLSRNNLKKYKVLVFPLVTKFGNKAKAADWRWEVINYVHEGGRILLTSDNTGIKGQMPDTLFPAIMEGSKTVRSKTVRPISRYSVNKTIQPFRISFAYQIELRRGSRGVVFLRNDRWSNVGIVGNYGKGKVMAVGFPFGVASKYEKDPTGKQIRIDKEITPDGQEARLLVNAVRWLGSDERYDVPNVWIAARNLKPLNKGPSRILDRGDEGGKIRLKAGAASVDITPPNPVGRRVLSGLGRGKFKCKGVHDRLMLRALVLDNSKTKLAIITMDRIATVNRNESKRIRKAIKDKTGIPEDNVLINCTHTHGGTWSAGINLVDKAVEAVSTADSRLKPARLGAGSKMIYGICANIRKRWHDDYKGLWQNQQPNPDGVMDNECGVVRVEDDDRKLIAIVVNYTGTPSSSGRTPYITGDYAGIAMHHLEKKFGCVALFTQGFQGNVFTSAFRINRTMKDAERLGKKLADEAASIVPHIDVRGQITLAAAREHISLPQRQGKGRSGKVETQALLIGDCLFVLGEPEVYVEIGIRIKEALSRRYSHVFCCGVGGYAGRYLTWRRGFGTDHRDADSRMYAYTEDAEGVLVDNIMKLVKEAEKKSKDAGK